MSGGGGGSREECVETGERVMGRSRPGEGDIKRIVALSTSDQYWGFMNMLAFSHQLT